MKYMCGFGNHFESEAIAGALPVGRNSPQKPALGLYAEQFSTSAFTAPRAENRRTWLYRIRPTAEHKPFEPYQGAVLWRSGLFDSSYTTPNRLRWNALEIPKEATDFIDGMISYGGNGDPSSGGVGIHLYAANADMTARALQNSDGEMLIVPQVGALLIQTELGKLEVIPGHIAVIPRGMRFRVVLPDGNARGYVCENYGRPFQLPDLGPIGANGLAGPRDFQTPIADFEQVDGNFEIIQKFQGSFWSTVLNHSPFDVVAWHGNTVPYRYDLARFNTIGTVSFDHPDPSIFTVLTSPGEHAGTANCDFVIFPPRWMVAEDTFRPPYFHRNVMSEFMGLIQGVYDAKEDGGFDGGGASLHNQFSAHGPDSGTARRAGDADLKPYKIDETLAFMFETRLPICPTEFAMTGGLLQSDYNNCWTDFQTGDFG